MNTEQLVLPPEPAEAVKLITKIAQQLLDVMENEGRALMTQDSVSFTAAQDEKKRLNEKYHAASQEFQRRIMDFRGVDKALLDKLDAVQRELKAKALENNAAMERMKA